MYIKIIIKSPYKKVYYIKILYKKVCIKKLKSTIKTEFKKITDPKIYVVVNVHFELSNLGNCKFS